MRTSTILNFLFASATIAAPILEGVVPDLAKEVDVSKLTGELPVRREVGVPALPALPIDDLTKEVDVGSLTEGLPVRRAVAIPELNIEDLTKDLDVTKSLPGTDALGKRLLGADGLLGTVDDLLSDVLGLTKKIDTDLSSLLEHLEDVDVQGVLGDVLSLVNALLAEVSDIAGKAGVDLDLSSLQPTVNQVNGEVNALVAKVQKLIDAGIVGDLVDEIKSVLADVLKTVNNIVSLDTVV